MIFNCNLRLSLKLNLKKYIFSNYWFHRHIAFTVLCLRYLLLLIFIVILVYMYLYSYMIVVTRMYTFPLFRWSSLIDNRLFSTSNYSICG